MTYIYLKKTTDTKGENIGGQFAGKHYLLNTDCQATTILIK